MSTQPDHQSTKSETHTCAKLVGGMWSKSACGKTATFYECYLSEWQWFCKTHAPSQRQARQQARDDARRKTMAPILERQQRQRQLERAAPDLRDALIGILELGRKDTSNEKYDGYYEAARAAIAKAESR